jgi:hypothetical protein
LTSNFVGLYADKRILPHPFNLPPQRGKAVQAVGVIGKIEDNDLGPIVAGATKSAVAEPHQHLATSLVRILVTSIGYWTAARSFTEPTPSDLPPPAADSRSNAQGGSNLLE